MKKLALLGVLGLFVLAGCGGYWMVTDPHHVERGTPLNK